SRYADPLHDVLGAAHHYGGDAVLLHEARAQADALVAHRAVGDEQGGVDVVGPAAGEHLRAVHLQRRPVAAGGGEAVEARGHAPDAPALRGAAQRGEREVGAGVLGAGVLAVDGDVGDAQVVVARGVAGVDGVELGRGVVGRAGALVALARLERGGGG